MVVDADDAPQKVAQVVQEQLQTTLPGFTLELKVEPKKQRVQDMQDGNFEIGPTRWGPDLRRSHDLSGHVGHRNSNNYGLWATLTTMPSSQSAPPVICAPIPRVAGKPCMTLSPSCWSRPPSSRCMVRCNAEMISSAVTGVDFHPVALNRVYKDAKKSV